MIGILITCCLLLPSERATLDASALKQRLGETHERIDSLEVTCFSDDYDPTQFPAGSYIRRVIAAKAPNLVYYWSGHGHQYLEARDDPELQVAYVQATTLMNVFPNSRSFFRMELDESAPLPGTLGSEFFFVATGFWPCRERLAPATEFFSFALREVAKSDAHVTVRPHLEIIEGRSCHVLEYPSRDILWLDADRGAALMRRDFYDHEGKFIQMRVLLGGHEEIQPGVWIPRWLRNQHFNRDADTQELHMVKNTRIEIENASINDVPETRFVWNVLPGAVELDRTQTTPPRQVLEGGLDHLDETVAWIQRVRALEPISPRSLAADVTLRAGMGIGIFTVLVLVFEWSRIRRRRTASQRGSANAT